MLPSWIAIVLQLQNSKSAKKKKRLFFAMQTKIKVVFLFAVHSKVWAQQQPRVTLTRKQRKLGEKKKSPLFSSSFSLYTHL